MHFKDMAENGLKNIVIRFVDILVIETAYFFTLLYKHIEAVWITFGIGEKLWFIPMRWNSFGNWRDKDIAVISFHTFTGCDSKPIFTWK